MNKEKLREKFKLSRTAVPKEKREALSELICYHIMAAREYKEAKNIMCYSAIGSEVNLNVLIARAIEEGKEVLFPSVQAEGKMIAVRFSSKTKKGAYGIIEPVGEAYTGEIDLVIVPCVAVNKEGWRIGYGKGYYDRFLKRGAHKKSVICAFSCQVTEESFNETFDQKADLVITENGVLM